MTESGCTIDQGGLGSGDFPAADKQGGLGGAPLLLGLENPTSGDVRYHGRSAASFSRRDVARRIQPIFQDPYSSMNASKTIQWTI